MKTGIARYQWTNPNNIILAKNGSRFLRELEIDLAVLGAEKANVNFTPQVNICFIWGDEIRDRLDKSTSNGDLSGLKL